MDKPRVTVVGSCNMDIYAMTEHLPEPGETVIGNRYIMTMGGKGANQAVAASKLGADVTMVGRVGCDLFGTQMIETLNGYGIHTQHIHCDDQAGSGTALIVVDKRPENMIVVIPGTNMRIQPEDIQTATVELQSSKVLLMQLEIPLAAIETATEIARAGGCYCILNPAPARPLPEKIMHSIDLLTPNQNEAKLLTGIPADTLEGAEKAGNKLLEMGAPAVIITLGIQGALLVKPGKTIHIPAFRIDDAIDPSGAGDAFMGGLAIALAEGKPLGRSSPLWECRRGTFNSQTRSHASHGFPGRTGFIPRFAHLIHLELQGDWK